MQRLESCWSDTYSQGITRLPCSSNKLSKDIELNFDASSGKNDSSRNSEEDRKSQAKEDGADTGVGGPGCYRSNAESNTNNLYRISQCHYASLKNLR